jgi:hypothetical protein
MSERTDFSYSLSDDDMAELLNGKYKIVTSRELSKYRNIDDLLEPYGHCIILYESMPNNGHWTALMKRPRGRLEFFDSYGLTPDSELGWLDPEWKRQSKQTHTNLIRLMLKSPYTLEYNDHKLQGKGREIATCGRHVVCRIRCRRMNIDNYAKMISSVDGMSPDDVVVRVTNQLFR